jgi:serine/threonine protein kinase/ligand-binding sensor domain-containing protein
LSCAGDSAIVVSTCSDIFFKNTGQNMDNLQEGQSLGPYRILGQIGQGGMATVYKAYHAAMNRSVALKVLPQQLAENPEYLGRFRQEAQIIANLEHAHILPVHDFGADKGYTYLVMRLFESGTLKDRMRERALSLGDIDHYFSQLADALDYAHAHGVIHRDIKPSNALVDAQGNLFLTDFGIAKILEGSSQFTSSNALIGTPDYMSPEQAQGLPVDSRSDIYSLGIILYEMVTGQVPFEAETPLAVVLKHINAPLPLPTSIKPNLSLAIEQVLLKALAKSPEDRFESAGAFQKAWKDALQEARTPRAAGAGKKIEQPDRPEKTKLKKPKSPEQPARRSLPLTWIAAAGVLGLLLAGWLVISRLTDRPAQPNANQPDGATATADFNQTGQPGAVRPGAGHWTSWEAANHTWSVAIRGDEVITGGHGLTFWKQKDGSPVRRFQGPGDGMPDAFQHALLVDPDGILWTGTPNGLGRYDGKSWTIYGMEDGLDSSSVHVLAWTKNGLLVGTQYCGQDGCGLSWLTKDGFKPVPGFPSVATEDSGKLSNFVTSLLPTKDGGFWVGTMNGLAHFDGKRWQVYIQADGLPNSSVYALLMDQDGVLWVGTGQGAARFDGQRFQAVEQLRDTMILDILQDTRGNYWFSCVDGLNRYDPAASDWQRFTQEKDGLSSYSFYHAALGEFGRLYFGGDNGLVVYDGKTFSTWAVPNVPTTGSFGRILAAPDGSGLWFVERYNSPNVDRFDLKQNAWNAETGLPNECSPLAVDSHQAVWCGGSSGVWIARPGEQVTHLTSGKGLPSEQVTAIAIPDGGSESAWVGTVDKGLAFWDGQKIAQVYSTRNGLSSDVIQALLAARDGTLWVGTDKGLDRMQPGGQWEHYGIGSLFGEGMSGVTDIAEEVGGAVWVSAAGEGPVVRRFADGRWQKFAEGDPGVSLTKDFTQSINVAPDGSIWFGGYYGGAARFDGKSWTAYRVQDGLLDANVMDIFVEKNGAAWFATEDGISRYTP